MGSEEGEKHRAHVQLLKRQQRQTPRLERNVVVAHRRTVVVHGRLAMRELRLDAARERRHGLQIMTFEQIAARLAGGLTQPVDDETLRAAIQATLPETELGELDAIKEFPGMVSAAVDTSGRARRSARRIRRACSRSRPTPILPLDPALRERTLRGATVA